MRGSFVVVIAAAAGLAGVAAGQLEQPDAQEPPEATVDLTGDRLVDLSHAFNRRTIYWPTAQQFRLTEVADGETEGGWHYAANNFRAAEHGGTHLDAPIHFARNGDTADEIPLRKLAGPAVNVDVRAKADADRDYLVTVADLEAFEAEHGRIATNTVVLLRTGWARHWPDARRYMGTADRGADAVPNLHFPGLSEQAARWLVEQRRVKAVGIDTASIDRGQSTAFEAHRVLAAAQVPVFENVANLDRLPAEGFHVIALPMKIEGGSGGPLRALAFVGD
ncbi:cyclase family protein [Solirubrobacter sp. CPCC 204708]|uniref:Cyclase family protein n=1 Tax=Solirubrobacter deserti TaxID=2282478 RepID=A0ABT4RM18_9ACTN|nr:cyclase family protein [Solirubrobacter deserti]MBE2314465.1 cyclase family protein [Solirubrobacter deserti]MDA0139612.1 cyclase family protein [Solirubrobacter deserti]